MSTGASVIRRRDTDSALYAMDDWIDAFVQGCRTPGSPKRPLWNSYMLYAMGSELPDRLLFGMFGYLSEAPGPSRHSDSHRVQYLDGPPPADICVAPLTPSASDLWTYVPVIQDAPARAWWHNSFAYF